MSSSVERAVSSRGVERRAEGVVVVAVVWASEWTWTLKLSTSSKWWSGVFEFKWVVVVVVSHFVTILIVLFFKTHQISNVLLLFLFIFCLFFFFFCPLMITAGNVRERIDWAPTIIQIKQRKIRVTTSKNELCWEGGDFAAIIKSKVETAKRLSKKNVSSIARNFKENFGRVQKDAA